MQKKLIEFFETHPDTDTVFVALGILFLDIDKATAYCGGTTAKVDTFTRVEVMAPAEKVEIITTDAGVKLATEADKKGAEDITHVVTDEDLKNNPGLADEVKVGEEITIPGDAIVTGPEAEKEIAPEVKEAIKKGEVLETKAPAPKAIKGK